MCSYHAYNRCDGAGVIPKRLSKQAQRSGAGPRGAAAYSHAVNLPNYDNHVAFYFSEANRSEYVFSSQLEKHTNLRPMCDFRYYYTNIKGKIVREPGIVLVKSVSDDQLSYQVIDLLRRPTEEKMCARCSQRLQRPVRHVLERSKCIPPTDHSLLRSSLVTPLQIVCVDRKLNQKPKARKLSSALRRKQWRSASFRARHLSAPSAIRQQGVQIDT